MVVGGLIAREFGGGQRAQLLAAIGVATMPVLLGAAHLANTTAYELLAWAALALVVARIGRTGDCRWWLAGGLVAGLGVADDHSMSFFAIALVIGALLGGDRRMIWNRWFLAGAAIAVAFEVPDLWWQAQHQWATIAMARRPTIWAPRTCTCSPPALWPSTYGCRRGPAGCAICCWRARSPPR